MTSAFSPYAPQAVSRKTPRNQIGGRASSQTKIEAQIGEPWVTASTHPPADRRQCAADHRRDRAAYRAAAGDPGQQRAETVVVGDVLDEAQHLRRRQPGDPGQQSDDDYRAEEVEIAAGRLGHPTNVGSSR